MESTVQLSGEGLDVHGVSLEDGVYFCKVNVSNNVDEDGDAMWFSVAFSGREGGFKSVCDGSFRDWTGRTRIVVGEDFEFNGMVDVEVDAAPFARWELTFELQ